MYVRLITWIFVAVLLSMLPLIAVAVIGQAADSGVAGFLKALSTDELFVVAFTLSGGAAVDVLVNSKDRGLERSLGLLTLLLTFLTIGTYVLIKTNVLPSPPSPHIVHWIQFSYLSTVVMSFFCEYLA